MKVLVVEDHEVVAHGLAMLLRSHGVETVAMDGAAALAAVERDDLALFDLVVLDLDLDHGIDGVTLVAPFRARDITVLVCTAETGPLRLARCLDEGATAVYPKHRSTEDLVASIVFMLSCGHPTAEALSEQRAVLAAARAERERLQPFETLSPRESEILAGLMQGFAPAVIARSGGVTLKTVRNQIEVVLQKLHVRSQLQAVALARQAGWTHP